MVFALGGVGCGLAPSIEWLIFFRFVKGIGAAAVMVIHRAIVRDLHTGVEATRLMATMMLVFSVSPILAPLAGSAVIVPFGWRAVFLAVTVAAMLVLVLTATSLPETRAKAQRIKGAIGDVFGSYGRLLCDCRLLGLTFIGGLGMASFLVFLASSSFVYIGHFGLTPTEFSLAFSVNAIGLIGASQFAAKLGTRLGMARVVTTAVAGYTAMALVLFAVTAAGVDLLPVLMAFLFLAFACLGLVVPSTMVLALEEHGPIAGMAAALGGTLQFLSGAATITIASVFFDGTSLPMVSVIAACAFGAFALSRITLGRPALAPQMAE